MAGDYNQTLGLTARSQEERRVFQFVWGFRLLTSVLALGGLVVVLTTQAQSFRDYLVDALAFLTPLTLGLVMAAITRAMHVSLERTLRAQLATRNIQLQDMAMRDDLTQLFNRRYFYERLQRELDDGRGSHHHLGVVVLDVDGLKQINDTYGHKIGDAVLAAMGRMLAERTRACDVAARIGGDEFAVILGEVDKRGTLAAARRLQTALEGATVYDENGASLKLRVSLGISGYPWGGDTVDDIMRSADSEMYADKAARRHQRAAVAESAPV